MQFDGWIAFLRHLQY